ncbi:MAG: hypothetical protein KatS3mg110_1845 [Pirellulaceae bacterium]|nr:MAG: hypothetical protein KatS3mg110_1845 [Pirellulaceae bacterium]
MTRTLGLVLLGQCLLHFAWLSHAHAQPPDTRRIVAVTPDQVRDEDYQYQGDWWGRAQGGCRLGSIGLQVVALGNRQFQARWLEGGLPGAGPVVLPGYVLKGERRQDELHLADGSGRQVRLTRSAGLAIDARGDVWKLERFTRTSPTLGLKPQPGAVVLFDSSGPSEHLLNVRLAPDGTLLAGAITRQPVSDCFLHLEFRTPYMPQARGQARGNSGVYLQRRYEVQILDSFGLDGANNECGALYRLYKPDLNMCYPPLAWQTYDIYFRAARFDAEGNKIADAQISVFHNGVGVHYHRAIPSKTGAGRTEGPEPLPILFQDHGNPVTFRNIWMVPEKSTGEPPVAQIWPRRRWRLCPW